MSQITHGLDLSAPDSMTDHERGEIEEFYAQTKGALIPSYRFWLDNRVGVAKRQKKMTAMSAPHLGVRVTLGSLVYYSILGYDEGILYQTKHSRSFGASKGLVLDTLAVAMLHASAKGGNAIGRALGEYMDNWDNNGDGIAPKVPVPQESLFPESWSADPGAFVSGIDFSDPDMSPAEVRLLEAWHLDNGGEVPEYVRFLGTWRPQLLKAHRDRIEHAFANGSPKQLFPYLELYWAVIRGDAAGIREYVLLAKAWGVDRDDILDSIIRPFSYSGATLLAVVQQAVGDVLETW